MSRSPATRAAIALLCTSVTACCGATRTVTVDRPVVIPQPSCKPGPLPRTCNDVEPTHVDGRRICYRFEPNTDGETEFLRDRFAWDVAVDKACP